MLFILFTLCFILQQANGAELTIEELQANCPDDKELCMNKARQNCCHTIGDHDMKFCLPICRYNTTTEELTATLGLKCVSQLTTWTYCAADGSDNSDCCRAKGIPNECLSFCQGNVPACDTKTLFGYETCLKHIGSILQCQQEGLSMMPKFDPDYTADCEWDG
ncbi:hypothetical protein WR25_18749 [Diploscapter pachys]|uniref:Domain of unknown function DB domain-containing protein n=1 Tax=Diploscapter pachys TaxID=2018661 RepID=A0A2A2KSH5_9BILA|nr:hypothetical protein WR25_18749 [Diploscapter pachys]